MKGTPVAGFNFTHLLVVWLVVKVPAKHRLVVKVPAKTPVAGFNFTHWLVVWLVVKVPAKTPVAGFNFTHWLVEGLIDKLIEELLEGSELTDESKAESAKDSTLYTTWDRKSVISYITMAEKE